MRTSVRFFGFFLIFFYIASLPAAYAADAEQAPKKILVLPPVVHAAQDLSYLKKGIVDMLASRLVEGGAVKVISQGVAEQTREAAGDIAAAGLALGADYVVQQSVTVIGNGVSTDAKVIETRTGQVALAFGRAGSQPSDVIAHIDQLAAEINMKLFGIRQKITGEGAVAMPNRQTVPQPPADEVHQHPEKLLNQSSELNPEGVTREAGSPGLAGFLMRSRRMEDELVAVSAGDVDGDGNPEIVCCGRSTVYIYATEKGSFIKKAEIKGSGSYIAIDAADVNANGKAEIFVTNYDNDNGRLKSFVLEHEDGEYRRIGENLRWYFQKLSWPERGEVLAGQHQGFKKLFSPGIHEIGYESGTYDSAAKLPIPADLNIFGIALGPVQATGADDIVAYSSSDYVQILDSRGKEVWTSSERYGGSGNAIKVHRAGEDKADKDLVFLPLRMKLFDMDGDGRQEIFTISNEISTGRFFAKVRLFKQGRLEALRSDELGLTPVWRTRDLAKHISDFMLVDLTGDKRPEAVAAVVQKDRSGFGSGRSFLAVFEIGGVGVPADRQ